MRKTAALIAAAAGLLAAGAGSAQSYQVGALKIDHPWAAPTPVSAPTGAGYLSVTNTGSGVDRLVSVSSPGAERAEVHTMSMDGGIMRMRPVTGGVEIKPHQTLVLGPQSGLHLMFIHPRRPFKAGDRIPGMLSFAHAGSVRVTFVVEAASGTMAGMAGMPGMGR